MPSSASELVPAIENLPVPKYFDGVQGSSVRQPEQEVRPGGANSGIGLGPLGDNRGLGVEVDPPLRRPVSGVELEGAAEALDPLLSRETGKELDDELLDPCGGHLSVHGPLSAASVSNHGGVLGIPAMDRHLDRETPAPPAHSSVTGGRERPGKGVRIGDSEHSESPVQGPEVPRCKLGGILRRRVEGTPADALTRLDDGRHPQEDAAGVANQPGSVPAGAVRHRSFPVGLGSGQEGTGVILGRRQQR